MGNWRDERERRSLTSQLPPTSAADVLAATIEEGALLLADEAWTREAQNAWTLTTQHWLELAFGKGAPEVRAVLYAEPSGQAPLDLGKESMLDWMPRAKLRGQLSQLRAVIALLRKKASLTIEPFDDDALADEDELPIQVFISHSSTDEQLAASLCDLLVRALTIASERIRCTSVPGHRLPGGADVNETLRREIHECPVFLAVLTEASESSAYVMAEIGARWMAGGRAIILRGAGFQASAIRGPLADMHSLSLSSSDDLTQLVGDVADVLGLSPARPEVYSRHRASVKALSVDPDARPTAIRDEYESPKDRR